MSIILSFSSSNLPQWVGNVVVDDVDKTLLRYKHEIIFQTISKSDFNKYIKQFNSIIISFLLIFLINSTPNQQQQEKFNKKKKLIS